MTYQQILPITIITILLIGCAPLQQAPLIYASKTTVGIDLSTSTTESPGASISIGVKVVDAAYVPVAVSKDSFTDAQGNKKAFEIIPIMAAYADGTTKNDLNSLTKENRAKISDYLVAKQTEDITKKEFDDAQATQKQAELNLVKATQDKTIAEQALAKATQDKTISEQTILNSTAVKAAAEQILVKSTSDKTITEQALTKATSDKTFAEQTLTKTTSDKSVAEQAVTKAMSDKTTAEQTIKIATLAKVFADNEAEIKRKIWTEKKEMAEHSLSSASEAAAQLNTNKSDALSVYGRFDSKSEAKTTSPSASLTLGKIFSTGVASQNLTEAVKNNINNDSVVRCIESMKALIEVASGISPDQKFQLVNKIDVVCTQPAASKSK